MAGEWKRPPAPHATGVDSRVDAVATRDGGVVFRRLISYCNLTKMRFPSEGEPRGWCIVREEELSFKTCRECPFNEGVKPAWSDEPVWITKAAKIIYETNDGHVQAGVPGNE